MSSEVEGPPLTVPQVRRSPRVPSLRRVLRAPFRSVLHQQSVVNRNLRTSIDELQAAQQLQRSTMERAIGDLNGHLVGELAALQRSLHRLERRLESLETRTGIVAQEVVRATVREGRGPARDRATGPIPEGAGVNLVGDLTATTGLAQAGRRLAVGLRRRGVPMTATSVRSGAPRIDALFPAELGGLAEGTPYPVDLVTLNVNEIPAVDPSELGIRRTGRYAIGAWYWELETLPPELVEQVDRVDEIWAPTTFVQRALGRYTAAPIHIVPTIVPVFEVSTGRSATRRLFGVADDDVMFLFSFDFNSSVLRKNPFAVVDAYRRAFGPDPSGTRLVMKAINLANSPPFQSDLRAAVGDVGGVLIDEHLSQEELGDLFHAADVYVSLHRSEGFGLGMAEAMAIGKAVIGTGYSGNVDFMHGGNSCLVGYRLRPITQDDHRYSGAVGTVYQPGLLVAEPDVDQAADWMVALAADAELRERIGVAAAATIAARCSEEAVVDAAMVRLEDRWHEAGIAGSGTGRGSAGT